MSEEIKERNEEEEIEEENVDTNKSVVDTSETTCRRN